MPELYVAAGTLTLVAFNGPLDRDSLVVDRTRFKWVDVGDRILALEPFADLGAGERLIMQVGFKDKALPAKAVLAVVSKADVVDGTVEVDRRANTPEALRAALTQKEAELEALKDQCEGRGPVGLMFAGWLSKESRPMPLVVELRAADARGLVVQQALGYRGESSVLVSLWLHNLPGQQPWELGEASVIASGAVPVKVLSVQMKPKRLAPGEGGLVVVEAKTPPWGDGKAFRVVLADASSERHVSIPLTTE
jgi:uncharacterized protein (TIGR02268 family)